MFAGFFYLLRARGFKVSLNEWMTLMEGLLLGLHRSTMTGFYDLCRAVLVKSEADYDKFDAAFLEYFKDVPFPEELPAEVLDWLEHPEDDLMRMLEDFEVRGFENESFEELMRQMNERLQAQKKQHNGGNSWVGTQGFTPWGNRGWRPNGLRIGGDGELRTAMAVAGERKFRDFRNDSTLDIRQFQLAFRILRQFSTLGNTQERELDIERTVQDTCEHAGALCVRHRKPRKNHIKVLLLMDAGGTMEQYAEMCSRLFQAATKCNFFQDLKIYYFHNCIFSNLYRSPQQQWTEAVSTAQILKDLDEEWRVIIVGDAAMSPYELREKHFELETRSYGRSGLEWFEQFRNRYPHIVWLNPVPMPDRASYWTQTHYELGHMFAMYELTVEGLRQSMKRLMMHR